MQIFESQQPQQLQQPQQQGLALFRLGFRPFFLGGTLFSIVALVVWLLILRGVISFAPFGGSYWWHIHEMVFGFAAAIIAGFLLTAIQSWTGIRGTRGTVLITLFSLWVAGRVLLSVSSLLPSWGSVLVAIIDLSFLPAVAFVLAKPILAIRQHHNLFFVPLLLLFTLANLEMYLAVFYPTHFNMQLSSYAGVLLITFLMSVIAGRVVPMFTANGTNTREVPALLWLEILTNGSLAIAMFQLLLHPLLNFNPQFFGALLIIAGFGQLLRWVRWRFWITSSVPLLWSLYGALLFIWCGLILLGLSYWLTDIPRNHAWHLLTVGGMGGLILAMTSRVSLGHTGRALIPPKSMSIAYISISIAALVRTFGPWSSPENSALFIDISGLFWFIAFGVFVYNYGPMLLKARKDGRPG